MNKRSVMIGLSLFILVLMGTGCSTDSTTEWSFEEEGLNIPIELTKSIIKDIDWALTGTFISNGFEMRGQPNKIGFIDYDFEAQQPHKYMWHVWSEDVARKELIVVAVREGENQLTPMLYRPGNLDVKEWSIELDGAHNGADAHTRSTMGLPSPGKWALICFVDEEHFGNIVIEVH